MRLRLFLILMALVPSILFSQTTSISPYSGFGLGELAPQGYDQSFAMGGTGIGFNDSLSVNPMNPASYNNFKKHNPIFQVGYKGQYLRVSSDINSEILNNGTINNISLGFKIAKKMGWAIGFNPATTVGYKLIVGEKFTDADGNTFPVTYSFEGDGGYTKIYTGLSYQLFEKTDSIVGKISSLSVGVNMNIFTGNKNSIYDVVYNSGDFSYYNTRFKESQVITAFGFDLGLQYQTYLKKISRTNFINLSLGVSFNIPKTMNTRWETNYFTYSYDATGQIVPQDTIFFSDELKGKSFIPLRMGIGMMLDFSGKLQIGIDYEEQNWDDYYQTVEGVDGKIRNESLSNTFRFSAGLQYTITPMNQRKMNTPYLTMIMFRLGGRYSTNYLKFEDYQLKDKALSAGFNFPLSKSQSYSSINLGMEFGTQGTIENGLLQQDYFNFMIGLTLLPHRFNKWFVKRKYN